MLASNGYATKKALKAAVGQRLQFCETSAFSAEFNANGKNYMVGPSAYNRKWYAEVWCKDGVIQKVK